MTGLVLASCRAGEIPFDDALAAVWQYCRGTRELFIRTPSHPDGHTVQVPAYAYGIYDCTRPSADEGIAALDVLVIDGLNGRLLHPQAAALMEAGPRAWTFMQRGRELAGGRAFWELDRDEIKTTRPENGVGAALSNAFEELKGLKGVDLARAHKVLHHKMPRLFPLVDRRTVPALRALRDRCAGEGYWSVIHRELQGNEVAFDRLETALGDRLTRDTDVPLERLRLHDILLWLHATGNWRGAVEAGRTHPEEP